MYVSLVKMKKTHTCNKKKKVCPVSFTKCFANETTTIAGKEKGKRMTNDEKLVVLNILTKKNNDW